MGQGELGRRGGKRFSDKLTESPQRPTGVVMASPPFCLTTGLPLNGGYRPGIKQRVWRR